MKAAATTRTMTFTVVMRLVASIAAVILLNRRCSSKDSSGSGCGGDGSGSGCGGGLIFAILNGGTIVGGIVLAIAARRIAIRSNSFMGRTPLKWEERQWPAALARPRERFNPKSCAAWFRPCTAQPSWFCRPSCRCSYTCHQTGSFPLRCSSAYACHSAFPD
jgi:hypothetical protein